MKQKYHYLLGHKILNGSSVYFGLVLEKPTVEGFSCLRSVDIRQMQLKVPKF